VKRATLRGPFFVELLPPICEQIDFVIESHRSGARLLALTTLIVIVLVTAWIAYAPGLHGGFLFDDFANLPTLGATGPVDNWPAFWRYVTSGIADPTGRPIALLSFLADAHDWPADPYPFKRTNLLLHLTNAGMLMLLLRQLGRYKANVTPLATGASRRALRIDMAAILGAGLWLLHPLFVSTTLYIIQREAMLPAFFCLLGLTLWLRGRSDVLKGRILRGLLSVTLGLGVCTLLAVLSKANGALLPALALVIEFVWLNPDSTAHIFAGKPSRFIPVTTSSLDRDTTITVENHPGAEAIPYIYRLSMWLLAGLPTLVISGYLLYLGWMGFVHGVSALRPWTMGQRLLTETRVLLDYLDLLWMPRPFTAGLFNDQIQASQSLWSPATTLPAMLAVFGLIVGAWILRKKYAPLALAVLFYFVAQSMESTTISLELYFEHRNYLPAVLMFWPLALWLCGASFPTGRLVSLTAAGDGWTPKRATVLKATIAVLLLSGLAWMTHARATLWGDSREQTILWAMLNPHSPRAQANAAQLETASGQPQRALARLEPALHAEPAQVQLAFNLIDAQCMLGALNPNDLQRARLAMSTMRDPGTLLTQWLDQRISTATTGSCRLLDLISLESFVDAGLANHRLATVSGRQQDLLYLKGHIALIRRNPELALRYFNAALDQDVRPAAALNQAALLGSSGYPDEGLAHLKHYEAVRSLRPTSSFGMPWLHAKVLQHQNYWPNEIAHLRDTLQKDVQNRDTNGK
jgi:protein O-mannosyl-transferase